MSWQDLKRDNPELAEYGEKRFSSGVAYIGTVDAHNAPRVHPVTPLLREDRLFVYMHPTSPKAKDLQRNSHYALHCAVENKEGGGGEFYVRGSARLQDEVSVWRLLHPSRDLQEMKAKFILFELSVHHAFSMTYEGDRTHINRWPTVSST